MYIMRTTVTIDDELLAAAKRRARSRGMTLGHVVAAALRRELAANQGDEGSAPHIPVFTGGTGPGPGVDLDSNRALSEVLDEGLDLERRR